MNEKKKWKSSKMFIVVQNISNYKFALMRYATWYNRLALSLDCNIVGY